MILKDRRKKLNRKGKKNVVQIWLNSGKQSKTIRKISRVIVFVCFLISRKKKDLKSFVLFTYLYVCLFLFFFAGWTYLLQFVDTTGDIDDGREAYDAFLHRYPYCYGYWKKYADLEKRKGLKDRVMTVFERGITAITLSADLW